MTDTALTTVASPHPAPTRRHDRHVPGGPSRAWRHNPRRQSAVRRPDRSGESVGRLEDAL